MMLTGKHGVARMPYILKGAYDDAAGKRIPFEYRETDAKAAVKGYSDLSRDGVREITIMAPDGEQITMEELTKRAVREEKQDDA
jgi:hypothetical protein